MIGTMRRSLRGRVEWRTRVRGIMDMKMTAIWRAADILVGCGECWVSKLAL